MLTSEFIENVRELGYYAKKKDRGPTVVKEAKHLRTLAHISERDVGSISIYFGDTIPYELFHLFLEYINTPIDERVGVGSMFDVEDYLKEKFEREEEQPSSRMVIEKESRTISGKEYNILTARIFEKSTYVTGEGILERKEIDKYGTELDYTWKVIDNYNLGYDGPKEFKGKVIMVPKEGIFESKRVPIVGWAGVQFLCETTFKEDGTN